MNNVLRERMDAMGIWDLQWPYVPAFLCGWKKDVAVAGVRAAKLLFSKRAVEVPQYECIDIRKTDLKVGLSDLFNILIEKSVCVCYFIDTLVLASAKQADPNAPKSEAVAVLCDMMEYKFPWWMSYCLLADNQEIPLRVLHSPVEKRYARLMLTKCIEYWSFISDEAYYVEPRSSLNEWYWVWGQQIIYKLHDIGLTAEQTDELRAKTGSAIRDYVVEAFGASQS